MTGEQQPARCPVLLWMVLPGARSEGELWGPCGLPVRPGHVCCRWHWHLEPDAGELPSARHGGRDPGRDWRADDL